jgi:hypothetical protein
MKANREGEKGEEGKREKAMRYASRLNFFFPWGMMAGC